jgi:hypothetical protein
MTSDNFYPILLQPQEVFARYTHVLFQSKNLQYFFVSGKILTIFSFQSIFVNENIFSNDLRVKKMDLDDLNDLFPKHVTE